MIYDAAIIGAGPAGLICARNAARRGLRIALIDSHKKPGTKLSAAGGGKGNITNRILHENCYVGENRSLLRSAFRAFSCEDALNLMRELHLPFEERAHGQIFGLRSAALMAERLAAQCLDAGADFYFERTADKIIPPSGSGSVHASVFTLFAGTKRITARQTVLACGSPACPQLGTSDQLARSAAAWGHSFRPFRPVLVPLVMPKNWTLSGLEGISLTVRLGLIRSSGVLWPDPHGIRSMLFTHKGISGPAALVISCWWKAGEQICIDFLPGLSVIEMLGNTKNGKFFVRSLLSRHLPNRVADALCPPDLARRKAAELSKSDRMRLADAIHHFSVTPAGTEGMKRAEAAAGGISLASLTCRLESRIISNLFFCGEILDITGILGGYNIHWALASGSLVAKSLRLPSLPA